MVNKNGLFNKVTNGLPVELGLLVLVGLAELREGLGVDDNKAVDTNEGTNIYLLLFVSVTIVSIGNRNRY